LVNEGHRGGGESRAFGLLLSRCRKFFLAGLFLLNGRQPNG
jgi:hypothetical protein